MDFTPPSLSPKGSEELPAAAAAAAGYFVVNV